MKAASVDPPTGNLSMMTWQPICAVFRVLAVLALMLAAAPVARADATATPAITDQPFQLAESELAGASSMFMQISKMTPTQIGVIAIGAVTAGFAAQIFLGGGIYDVVAVVLGAALANHWYLANYTWFGLF
jgi:hypothetical protein